MTRLLALWLLVWPCALLHAQAVRLDPNYGNIASPFPGASRPLVTAPGATVTLCNNASLPCNSLATTYTDVTAGSLCPLAPIVKQVTSPGTSICTGVSDPTSGKFGWWVSPGTYYWSWFPPGGVAVQGPFAITAGSSASSTVTSVTGVAPIASTGGNTPAISISQSGTATNGYLSSADWNTFNGKQDHLSFTLPLSIIGSTVSISQATTSANGYLSSTDWNTFNNKQATVSASLPISISANNISISQSGTSSNGYLSSTDWNTFNNKQAAITIGPQLTYFRSKPNVLTPTGEFAQLSPISVRDYNFPAQTPGGTLTAGVVDTVTLSPQPLGVSWTDTNHYLRISGGSGGAAESVLIVGGTANGSGSGSGSIAFIPANPHSGAWQIASATDGWQEAVLQAQAFPLGSVHAPTGWYSFYAPVYIDITANKAVNIGGDGYGYFTVANATVVNNLATTPAFQIVGGGGTGCEAETILHDFSIHGSATSGTGISASNACQLRIEHIFEAESRLFGMSCGPNCYGVTMDHSYFYSNGLSGVSFSGVPNAISLNNVGVQNNCRQAAAIACHGESIDGGFQVSIKNSGFGLDGVQPIGGFPSVSYELSVSNSTAVTLDALYFEQPLTNAILLTNVQGFNITGTYIQQGGISIDAATKHGAFGAGNQLLSGNPAVNISNAVSNGGLCEITLSTAPPVFITIGSFYNVTGISGAPACNGKGQVQNAISSTHFVTSQAFSGAYTSGGTYERTSGLFIAGSSGNSDIHIFGGSDISDATLLVVGGDLRPGNGPNIASASVITPTHQFQTITGAATIDTMTPPSGFTGQFCAWPGGGSWSTSTAGNFGNTFTLGSNTMKCWAYDPVTAKWY